MTTNVEYGDRDTAETLDGKAKVQYLVGAAGVDNYVYGDAYRITDSWGGNDVLHADGAATATDTPHYRAR